MTFPPSLHFPSARHLSISPLPASRYSASPTHFSRSSLLPHFPIKKARPPARPYFFLQNFSAFRPKAAPAPLLCVSSLQSRSCTPPHNSLAIKRGIPQTPLNSHIKNNVRRTAPDARSGIIRRQPPRAAKIHQRRQNIRYRIKRQNIPINASQYQP